MKVALAYGQGSLIVDLPDERTDVVEPVDVAGLADEAMALRAALYQPLGTLPLSRLVTGYDDVVIVVNDGTRPMPSARVLPHVLRELAVVPRERITILVATGTHRANTPAELEAMLGSEITRNYRVVNHDARDESSVQYLGESQRGHPIYLNRLYMQARIKILTGFIEPHFFAGYSGGPKPVMPGIAGLDTVIYNHSPQMIGHPRATFGVLDGNPIHEEQREIALLTQPTFSVNVSLNKRHEITGAWAGEMMAVHAAGVAFVRQTAIRPISEYYDVVVSTNSGFPLDQNLYQTVKGMAAAGHAVRPGGVIIMAAECRDGLPGHGIYADLLASAASPELLLERIGEAVPPLADGWQAQIQAQLQRRATIYLYSSLPDEAVSRALLRPCHDIGRQVREVLSACSPTARVLALPQGPQTIVQAEMEAIR